MSRAWPKWANEEFGFFLVARNMSKRGGGQHARHSSLWLVKSESVIQKTNQNLTSHQQVQFLMGQKGYICEME